jgi:hypothetical protein
MLVAGIHASLHPNKNADSRDEAGHDGVIGSVNLARVLAALVIRMVQHVFAEIALAAVGARVGGVALNVAILAAGDVFRRAGLDIVGAAERVVVIAVRIDQRRLSALEATGRRRAKAQNASSR